MLVGGMFACCTRRREDERPLNPHAPRDTHAIMLSPADATPQRAAAGQTERVGLCAREGSASSQLSSSPSSTSSAPGTPGALAPLVLSSMAASPVARDPNADSPATRGRRGSVEHVMDFSGPSFTHKTMWDAGGGYGMAQWAPCA